MPNQDRTDQKKTLSTYVELCTVRRSRANHISRDGGESCSTRFSPFLFFFFACVWQLDNYYHMRRNYVEQRRFPPKILYPFHVPVTAVLPPTS